MILGIGLTINLTPVLAVYQAVDLASVVLVGISAGSIGGPMVMGSYEIITKEMKNYGVDTRLVVEWCQKVNSLSECVENLALNANSVEVVLGLEDWERMLALSEIMLNTCQINLRRAEGFKLLIKDSMFMCVVS